MLLAISTLTAVIATAITASVLAVAAVKLLDHLRKKDAEAEARRILERAQQEAATKLREAELEVKERSLKERADMERELNKGRDELRERERVVDKRQEALEQQSDDLRKQEKIVEGTQRRLTERLEETARRNEELNRLMETQRQNLYQLAGMTRDEAVQRIMADLDQELAAETGAVVLRHEKRTQELCDQKARDILLTALHRYAAAHTAESTTSTVDIPNDEMKGRIIGREG
ncbi:MAG: Rnase Y domain-containing protein, partial [Pirellulaceae bacterium]